MVVAPWVAPAVLGSFGLIMLGLGLALRGAMRPPPIRARIAAYVADARPQPVAKPDGARWQKAVRERERLRRWSALGEWHLRVAAELLAAELPLRPAEWTAIRVALGVGLGFLLFARFGNPLFALPGFLVGTLLPKLWLRRRQARRRQRIEDQLPDALDLIANAVRSGQTFTRGLQLVADELPPPLSAEAATALAEIQVGVPLEQTLENLARRTRLYDVELVVSVVQIQRSVGGDLGEVLRNISATIRERARIKAEVRTLTAQGRLSGWVIGLLPIALGIGLALLNPDYMRPLFMEPVGRLLLAGAGLLWVAGFLVVRRVVTVEY